MNNEKKGKVSKKLKLSIEIDLDPNSMLTSEEQIAKALNEAGQVATKEALELLDTDGSPIELGGKLLTSKGKQKKSTKRHTDQKK